MDLWAQIYLLDQGARLGKTITSYRNNYFTAGARNQNIIYEYKPRPESEALIKDKIKDLCISLRAQDYLKLPERIDDTRYITFEGTLAKQYKEFERDMFLQFDEEEIDVASAAALTNKLLQFCNGAVYREDHSYLEVHDKKLEMLSELLEGLEGKSVLVFYTFQHDLDRIQKLLKSTKLRVGHLKTSEDISKWNNKEIDVLLAHPASAAYGLNL
jgi:SNF2 family DNA or RNA helicase